MSTLETNPNGANQWQLDPRQKVCWDAYVNPKSKTFGNALQSALKAGYTEESAKHITKTDWFAERTRRLNLLNKSEKVLDETLDIPAIDKEGRPDAALQRVKLDAAKFVADRLGKDEGYSTKKEIDHTSKGEAITHPLDPKIREIAEEAEKKLKESL